MNRLQRTLMVSRLVLEPKVMAAVSTDYRTTWRPSTRRQSKSEVAMMLRAMLLTMRDHDR